MKHNAAFEADIGGHHLAVKLADTLAAGDHSAPRVQSIDLDGATLYPRDCAAKSKNKLLACSSGHRALKNADDLLMVANKVSEGRVELLLATRSNSSLDCGATAYWLLHIDKSGASASEPAAGCFTVPSLDVDALNPVLEWDPPLTVRTFDEKSQSCALVLPPGANVWRVSRAKKP